MASISNIISNFTNIFKKKKVLVNDDYSNHGFIIGGNQPNNYTKLSAYVKASGEILAIISAYVNDLTSDGFTFKGTPAQVKKAEDFCKSHNFKNMLKNALMDMFIYGNGYLVKSFVSNRQIKLKAKEIAKKMRFETKEAIRALEFKGKDIVDELATENMLIQYMPALTVSVNSVDKFANKVIYTQEVDTNKVEFDSSQVIHFKDVEIDGKLLGYSKIYSLISELQTLGYVKDYAATFFYNNGTPDLLFIAKNMHTNTPEYKAFRDQIIQGKSMEHKHKVWLATSDIDVKKLNEFNKDFEFEKLADYIVKTIAMTFQMPANRLGGTSGASGEETTLTNQGYFRNVSSDQDDLETVLNNQLWNPIFNVDFAINRGYREDAVRDAQIEKTKTDIAQQRVENNFWTRQAAMEYLNIPDTDAPSDEEVDQQKLDSVYRQESLRDVDTADEPDKQARLNKTPNKYKGTDSERK